MTLFKILLVYFLISAISHVVESEEEPDCAVKAGCEVPENCQKYFAYETCLDQKSNCSDEVKDHFKKMHADGLKTENQTCEAERPPTTTTPKAAPDSTTTPSKPTLSTKRTTETTPPAVSSPAPSCDADCYLGFNFTHSDNAICTAIGNYMDCIGKNCTTIVSELLSGFKKFKCGEPVQPPQPTNNTNPPNTANPSNATEPANGSNPMTTATSVLFLLFANAWIALATKIF